MINYSNTFIISVIRQIEEIHSQLICKQVGSVCSKVHPNYALGHKGDIMEKKVLN